MLHFILQQILNFILTLFILSLFSFGLALSFPQGISFIVEQPATFNLLQTSQLEQVIHNNNIFSDYFSYIKHLSNGEFGFSNIRGTSVFKEFFTYFPATIELSVCAMFFALAVGLPLGVLAAKQKNKWPDKLIVSTTLIGYSMPIFWWAMLLVLLFSMLLGITPVASQIGFEYDIQPITGFMLIDTLLSKQSYSTEAFYSALHHLILPAIVLGTIPLAAITRSTRSAMINILSEDYIRSAIARGLSSTQVIWKLALRNAMIPIMMTLGIQISVLITGSLITETIFSWPGAGKWILEAVHHQDFPVIHGGILMTAGLVIVSHLVINIFSMMIDPKQRRK